MNCSSWSEKRQRDAFENEKMVWNDCRACRGVVASATALVIRLKGDRLKTEPRHAN